MKTMISVPLVLILITAAMAGEYNTPNTFEANTPAVAEKVDRHENI